MKKIIALLLALTFIFVMFAMSACTPDEGEGKGTGDAASTGDKNPSDKSTEAPGDDKSTEAPEGDKSTEGPAETEGDDDAVVPGSVAYDGMEAPEGSQYFVVTPENVIHDGKGSWGNSTTYTAAAAFDNDIYTDYDCDEKNESVNSAEMEFGIAGDGTFETGYVGAYFADGIYLTHIRYAGRTRGSSTNEADIGNLDKDYLSRMIGGKFEVSTDGENWTEVAVVEERPDQEGKASEIVVPADIAGQVVNYVRYVGPAGGYCNVAEIELWGKPAK